MTDDKATELADKIISVLSRLGCSSGIGGYKNALEKVSGVIDEALSRQREEYEERISELEINRVSYYANAQRLVDWIVDPKRQPAITAFTSGPERQVAYAIERKIATLEQAGDELNNRLKKCVEQYYAFSQIHQIQLDASDVAISNWQKAKGGK